MRYLPIEVFFGLGIITIFIYTFSQFKLIEFGIAINLNLIGMFLCGLQDYILGKEKVNE